MRILLISSEPLHPLDKQGSCFELTQAKALGSLGHSVAILSLFSVCVRDLAKACLRKAMGQSSRNLISRRFTWGEISRLWGAWLRGRPLALRHIVDGVVVHEGLFVCPAEAAWGEAAPPFWEAAGALAFQGYVEAGPPEVIHGHSRFLRGAHLARSLSERQGIPYVVTEHSSTLLRDSLEPWTLGPLVSAYRKASLVLSVSSALARRIQEIDDTTRAEVVGNPLEPDFVERLSAPLPKEAVFTFLSVARLDSNKNQLLILHALATLLDRQWRLWVVGDGPDGDMLRAEAADLNVSGRIDFLGFQGPAAVKELMHRAHCLVISSHFETFGVVAIEAIACGIPVVTTRCGGPMDIVDSSNGFVAESGVQGMAAALVSSMEKYGSLDMETNRQRVLERYAPGIFASRLMCLYKEALSPLREGILTEGQNPRA